MMVSFSYLRFGGRSDPVALRREHGQRARLCSINLRSISPPYFRLHRREIEIGHLDACRDGQIVIDRPDALKAGRLRCVS